MPPGPNVLQQAGAKPSRETTGAALFHNRFRAGLVTQRNPLRDPSGVVEERWYGGRGDALLDGVNLELSNELTLDRAPGSTAYSSTTLPQRANSFYSFKQFTGSTETITVMVDTPSILYSINPTSKTTVLTKAAGAGPSFLIGVNNTLYIGDGAEQKAWSPVGGLRNWGIAGPPGVNGPTIAGAGANVVFSGPAWVNPNNVTSAVSFATFTGTGFGDMLRAKTFGFSPTGTVLLGMALTFDVQINNLNGISSLSILVTSGGSDLGGEKSINFSDTAVHTITLGGSTDLWGTSGLSTAQLSDATFGFDFFASAGTGVSSTISIRNVKVTIWTQLALTVALVAGGVSPAPSTGYKYVQMYGNNGQVFSAATLPSANVKPDATHSAQITLVASTDPQVNQIWLLRTKDGGSVYENLPTSPYPNSSGNVTDSAADTTLNPFQLADLTGLNTPPPSGFSAFEFHMGRIWGAVGNIVYYSVGSDLGFILGNGYEGFPPANFFTFPSQVVRLLSLSSAAGSVLLVFTVSDIYPIYGNASAAAAIAGVGLTVFYAGSALLKKVGLANYNALDARGSIVYMMTNDGRVISFNPTSQIIYTDPEKSINEIGFPIGAPDPHLNQASLANFGPSVSYVTWHGAGSADQALYVSDGNAGWFRCNPNQQPDGGMAWSTKRNIVGGCGAVQSIETSPGVFQLLIGPPTGGGSVLFRDPNTFSDNASSYPCNGLLGPLLLAQPGQEAAVEFITADFDAVGSQPTIGVLYNEIAGSMAATLTKTDNDPPHSAAPVSVFANRYYTRQSTSGTQGSVSCRWMQVKIDFGNDTARNRLLTLTLFGKYEQEA